MAEARPPHVLIFPFPAQGHVNSMLKLAELLCVAGFHVTFILSRSNHDRLVRHTNITSRFSKYSGFHLETLPSELYDGQIHTPSQICMMYDSLQQFAKPFVNELLTSQSEERENPPITTFIVDGIMSFVFDLCDEHGVPVFYFRTISACAFWAYFSIPRLIQHGDLPFSDDDMDATVTNVLGMEQILRRRDLPSFCQVHDLTAPDLKIMSSETQQTTRARGLILNTFDNLEGHIISHVRNPCPNIYAIGPIHALLKTRVPPTSTSSNSLWKEDRSCMAWLDKQPSKSVLYVSFGSITMLTRDQLLEFWHGLVNSGTRFLWVIRPDSIHGKNGESKPPLELEEATKERGYVVEWAPQEEVLGHDAVGGFLTHCGWNSTLESIFQGVPMICWPFFADQQINSRFVEKVWELGLDMKDSCDRLMVEKMVRDLMEVRTNEFAQRANKMSKLAREAVREGGSSFRNLDRLIQDIRLMSKQTN